METGMTARETADEIGRLAGESRDAAELRDLEQALRGLAGSPSDSGRARDWSAVDLFAAFLSEDPLPAGPGAEFWAMTETAVRVLVVVPILLVWAGLTWAAIVYRRAHHHGVLRYESFLQGWQNGMGGRLPGWFTFDRVAAYTAFVLFLLVVGIATISIRAKLREILRADLRHRLAAALTKADLELAPFRFGAPEQVQRDLSETVNKLAETARSIAAVGGLAALSQERATAALEGVAPRLAALESAATEVGSAASAVSSAAATLELWPDRVGGHFARLASAADSVSRADQALAGALSESAAQIADTMRDRMGEILTSLSEVTASVNSYVNRTEMATDIIGRANQAIGQLPAALAALRDDVSKLEVQVAGLTAAITADNGPAPSGGSASRLRSRRS